MSLIEVLISLLVLSIGLVGMGALMMTSLKNVHSSSQYSLASAIALDFEERLWHETARISAKVDSSLLDEGCLTDDQVAGVVDAMIARWSADAEDTGGSWDWTGGEAMGVPGLAIEVADTDSVESTGKAGLRWKEYPVTISWDESRFGGDGSETYATSMTVVCRPVYES